MTSRWPRWAVALVLTVAAILALAIAAVAAGVSFDASRWRDTAAQRASAALGHPVALHGPLRVTLGRGLVLLVGDVRVLGPAGFEATELASLGEARITLNLLDLLRGVVRPLSIEASDLTLRLERRTDGRGNWTPEASGASATEPADPDIGQVRLQRAAVHWHDARTGTRRVVELPELAARTGADGALQVLLLASLDASPLVELTLEGGPLRRLRGGDAPWPFKLDAKADAGRLKAGGEFDAGRGQAQVEFDTTLDDPARLARLLGRELPPLGAATLRGIAALSAEEITLTRLRGAIAGSDFSGELALNHAAPRPRLTGAVQFAQFDVGPWVRPRATAPASRGQDSGTGWQSVALRDLFPLDLELDLRVEHAIGAPLELRDVRLEVRGNAAGLRAPLSATVSGVGVAGELALDAATAIPALSLQLATRDQPIARLAQDRAELSGLEGTLGRLELLLKGRGETLGAWAQDLDASVLLSDLSVTRRTPAAHGPTTIQLDSLTLRANPSEGLRGTGRAVLAGERVAIAIRGGRLADLLGAGALPIHVEATAATATLRIATELAIAPSLSTGPLRFDFKARRSGDLANWLPVAPDSALPLALRGRLRLADASWHLEPTTLGLGRSDLMLEGSGARGQGTAVTALRVRSALLDLPELLSLRSATAPGDGAGALAFPDAAAKVDLSLELEQVFVGQPALRDVRAQAQIRQGRLLPTPLSGQIAGTAFAGMVEADLRAGPLARLELSASGVDVGSLLRGMPAADGLVDGRAESLKLTVQARGSNWSDFVEGAAVELGLRGGEITVRATRHGEPAEIKLRNANLELPHGGRLGVRLDGTIEGTPVQVDVRGGTLAQLLRGRDRLPFELSARAPGTLLSLDGTLGLPLGSAADLRLQASGGRLDSLDGLSPVALPAWGPWSIDGPVRATPAGVEMPNLEVRVGNSQLSANAQLDLAGQRPQLDLKLSSSHLELDDFPSPTREPRKQRPSRSAIGTARDVTQRTGELLVAQWLRGFDAKVDLQADQVVSSDGLVAQATLRARLNQGRLDVGPAALSLPGGSVRVSMSTELLDSRFDFAVAADIERFDYGFIAAVKGGGNEWHGLVSMRLQLHGSAPSLDAIPLHARGQVDLAAWPNDLRPGQFNLWSVNLLMLVTNRFTPQAPPRLNCIVGRFNFNDGVVTEDQLVVDTTALRIQGVGHVDLASEELDFVFRPRAKGFAMFKLQQPLRVGGTISDPRIGTERRDTPETILRLIASPVLWPLERLRLGPLPRDGADVCTDPLRATPG